LIWEEFRLMYLLALIIILETMPPMYLDSGLRTLCLAAYEGMIKGLVGFQ
jgi:hypothetical protein